MGKRSVPRNSRGGNSSFPPDFLSFPLNYDRDRNPGIFPASPLFPLNCPCKYLSWKVENTRYIQPSSPPLPSPIRIGRTHARFPSQLRSRKKNFLSTNSLALPRKKNQDCCSFLLFLSPIRFRRRPPNTLPQINCFTACQKKRSFFTHSFADSDSVWKLPKKNLLYGGAPEAQ